MRCIIRTAATKCTIVLSVVTGITAMGIGAVAFGYLTTLVTTTVRAAGGGTDIAIADIIDVRLKSAAQRVPFVVVEE
jgi:hypothetical protein